MNDNHATDDRIIQLLIEETKKGKLIVMLLTTDTSTKWFKKLQEHGAMFLWINDRPRVNTLKRATFQSKLAILYADDKSTKDMVSSL